VRVYILRNGSNVDFLDDSFAELIGKVKYVKVHESGGHFAAWER
jgi:hypothetical protein